MTPETIMDLSLNCHLADLTNVCRKHGVRSLVLFGSAAGTDQGAFDRDRSDVDLLVEFLDPDLGPWMKRFFDLQADLEKLFGRRVDLVLPASLNKERFRASVETTKVPLYAAA